MSRPVESPPRQTINIRLDPDLVARLETVASERVLSRTKLIALLLERALDQLDQPLPPPSWPYQPLTIGDPIPPGEWTCTNTEGEFP